MPDSYDLTRLDPNSFEHLTNLLALRVLGLGHTGFGPGPDGGRDGYFEGPAPYPSESNRWSGRWYIQSKFHKPSLSKDPQKWLLDRIREELEAFEAPDTKRTWPDNWIVSTNIDPSGSAQTGAFDRAVAFVKKARPDLAEHFHIWGGSKILSLLTLYPDVAKQYLHFLTPGDVLATLFNQIRDAQAEIESILRFLVVKQFSDQQYTKLEQAGSPPDTRPGIHRLFTDLPFLARQYDLKGMVTDYLVRSSAKPHRIDGSMPDTPEWRLWRRHPSRARVWFVKGGPGQGKSTVAQYICQLQRAALILQANGPLVAIEQRGLAEEIRPIASQSGFWPEVPRVPISIELKEFAQWFGRRKQNEARGVLTYLAEHISVNVEQNVHTGTLKRALRERSWLVVFDGLDEVPSDVKDMIASEVRTFIDHVVPECNADAFVICTSRPQGYSGQFAELDGPIIDLSTLSPAEALACAKPILHLDRSATDAKLSLDILTSAIESSSVRELMTTPLQAHIMAVVVRDGGKPPERRWQLFTNFYQVIKRREANRNLPDTRLAKLLRESDKLLKDIHNRLGFVLHYRAETSRGAQTYLERGDFRALVQESASQLNDRDIEGTVELVMEATIDRLVLVNTPEQGSQVRFDIRPLQEFFAAEYLYDSTDADTLRKRLEVIGGDSHWREVMHFLLSALIENGRQTELSVAIQVLERLNEGSGETYAHILSHRSASGAILAARLFQEGVLEQDKRIRHQFRNCLLPLLGFTNATELAPLSEAEQPNSRAWLIDFMMESLQELTPTENIGAMIVLAQIISDDDDNAPAVREFMLNSSDDYRSAVFEALRELVDPVSEKRRPSWLIEVALRSLLKNEGFANFKRTGFPALSILKGGRHQLEKAAERCGLSKGLSKLLPFLLCESPHNARDKAQAEISERHGIVECKYYEPSDFASSSIPDETLQELSQATGILQFLYCVLKFARAKTRANFSEISEYVNRYGDVLRILPEHLMAQLPLEEWGADPYEQIQKLRDLDDGDFVELMRGTKFGRIRIGLSVLQSPALDLRSWESTIDRFPALALSLWSPSLWNLYMQQKRPDLLDTEPAVNLLIDACIRSPRLLVTCVESWGRLLEKGSPQRKNELRAAMLAASERFTEVQHGLRGSVSSFRLNLPAEQGVLPHILPILLGHVFPDSLSAEKIWRMVPVDTNTLIPRFVKSVHSLEPIINDQNTSNRIRAAALIMYCLHPDCVGELRKSFDPLLSQMCDSSLGDWYLEGVGNYVQRLRTENNASASHIMGKMLDQTRADYAARRILGRVLAVWRESSSAPVQAAYARGSWK